MIDDITILNGAKIDVPRAEISCMYGTHSPSRGDKSFGLINLWIVEPENDSNNKTERRKIKENIKINSNVFCNLIGIEIINCPNKNTIITVPRTRSIVKKLLVSDQNSDIRPQRKNAITDAPIPLSKNLFILFNKSSKDPWAKIDSNSNGVVPICANAAIGPRRL